MRMKYPTTLFAISLFAGACAQAPIVDQSGVDPVMYEQDLRECESYAAQVNVGQRATAQAAASATLGAVIGAAVGNSSTVGELAGAGGALGAAKGTQRGLRERRQVVRNCLRNRGYAVLN